MHHYFVNFSIYLIIHYFLFINLLIYLLICLSIYVSVYINTPLSNHYSSSHLAIDLFSCLYISSVVFIKPQISEWNWNFIAPRMYLRCAEMSGINLCAMWPIGTQHPLTQRSWHCSIYYYFHTLSYFIFVLYISLFFLNFRLFILCLLHFVSSPLSPLPPNLDKNWGWSK